MPNDAFAAGIGDYRIVTTLCPGGKERMRRLMEMVRHKCADLTPLLTHTFTLDQIAEAYKLFGDKHHRSQPRRSPWASNKSRSEAAGGIAFQEGLLPRKLVPDPVEIHVGLCRLSLRTIDSPPYGRSRQKRPLGTSLGLRRLPCGLRWSRKGAWKKRRTCGGVSANWQKRKNS